MNHSNECVLSGLDGSNPLAFLTALGTLRTLSKEANSVTLSWRRDGKWTPVLHFGHRLERDEFISVLHSQLTGRENQLEFNQLGKDLTVAADEFRRFACSAARQGRTCDRATADFAAAFGCEITTNDNGIIQDTALRTMAGAGHQHFLGFMRNIIQATKPEHLQKTLFEQWRYDDPVQNLTLRWDPIDDVRYALRWRNPSGDPSRKGSGSVLGANRLAIEALPLIVTAPVGSRLRTTGFRGTKSSNTFWTWPIWEPPLSLDSVRSVLALRQLQGEELNQATRIELNELGIVDVFRSQRLTIGKVRNFAPARAI